MANILQSLSVPKNMIRSSRRSGWLDLPVNYDKEEFARIKEAAKKIREDSDVLLVAGIGGSYLGARAVVEAVKGLYHNDTEDGLKIYFCGNTISPTYLNDIIKVAGRFRWPGRSEQAHLCHH